MRSSGRLLSVLAAAGGLAVLLLSRGARDASGERRAEILEEETPEAEAPAPSEAPPLPPGRGEVVAGKVRGRLVVRDGSPHVEVALVRVIDPGGEARSSATSSRGAFEVAVPLDVRVFRFEVEADFAAYAKEEWFAPGTEEVRRGVTLVIEPAGTIEGTLRHPLGAPAAGRVAVVSVRNPLGFTKRQVPAERGRFVARGLRPGKYAAVAQAPGFGLSVPTEIEVRAGQVSDLDLVLGSESFLAGRIVDPDGKGVPGAQAVAYAQSRLSDSDPTWTLNPFRATADSEGRFRLGALRPGEWDVRAEKPGMRFREPANLIVGVPAGAGAEDVVLVLEPGRFLAGRVVDPDGAGLPGAKVTAEGDHLSQGARIAVRVGRYGLRVQQSGTSDENGTFRLTGLPEFPSEVEATLAGHGTVRLQEVPVDTEGLEIVLPGPTGVAGVVRDAATGAPVARFTVEILMEHLGRYSRSVGNSFPFAASDGSFEISHLLEASWDFLFAAEGYVPVRLDRIEVRAGEVRRDLVVPLRAAGAIRGTVVYRDSGAPVSGATVYAPATGEGGSAEPRAETDEEGRFELGGIPAGPTQVWVTRFWSLFEKAGPFEVPPQGVLEGVTIVLPRGGTIEGHASRPDAPTYEGGMLDLRPAGDGSRGRTEWIGPGGMFRVEGLPAGRWAVVAKRLARDQEDVDAAERGALRAIVLVEEGMTTQVEFETGRPPGCRLAVRVARGAEGVVGARVAIAGSRAAAAERWSLFDGRMQAETSESGVVVFEGVPPGPATIYVGAGSANLERGIDLPPSGEHRLEIELPSGEIRGRAFRAEDRAGVRGMRVRVEPASDRGCGAWGNAAAEAFTDAGGRFHLRDLPAGSYWVLAGGEPGQPRLPMQRREDESSAAPVGPIELGEEESVSVEIPVVRAAEATVTVVDPEGRPVEGAWVQVRSLAGGPLRWRWAGAGGLTDARGMAQVARLAPGRHFAAAAVHGHAECFSETKEVRSGGENRFQVVLERGTRVRIAFVGEDGGALPAVSAFLRDREGRETLAGPAPAGHGPAEERGKSIAYLPRGDYIVVVGESALSIRVGEASPQDVVMPLGREAKR